MILTENDNNLVEKLLFELNKVFNMKDMGDIYYFLEIQVHRHQGGLFLNQSKYATYLLIYVGMKYCALMSILLPIKLNNLQGQDEHFAEPSYFRSLAGKLQYLTLTRSDL